LRGGIWGGSRRGGAEFRHFLRLSSGSASEFELEYHLLLARDLAFRRDDNYDSLAAKVTEVKRMLAGLVQTLNTGRSSPDRQLTADT
jgi:four helix bundle protein